MYSTRTSNNIKLHETTEVVISMGGNLKPENPVLKEIFETQTETDIYLAKFLKT